MFHGFLRIVLTVLISSLLLSPSFAADHAGGVQSHAAGIMLRAVLQQSLSMSVDPQPVFFDWFVSSNHARNFPVNIRTNWVRGPGKISVVVLSSYDWMGVMDGRPISVETPGANSIEIQSGQLPLVLNKKDQVLTIRAQAI